MDALKYQSFIDDLCRLQPGCDARVIAAYQHIEIDGHLIGLIPGDDESLWLFIEVAPSYPDLDADLYRNLLIANTSRRAGLPGWFGLHPTGHAVAYCLKLSDDTQAEAVIRILAEQIPLACAAYEQACLPGDAAPVLAQHEQP